LLFCTGNVTVKTYIFVVAPLAFGAFLMAFMIPEPSAFAPQVPEISGEGGGSTVMELSRKT
jgi:hypothetical protein